MKKLAKFVSEHLADDCTRLILDRAKWPEIDMDLVVNCIESRRKLKGKVDEWYDESELIFPFRLSAEQCSSSATGEYKAALAERILATRHKQPGKGAIADLTGGLGVASWFFSKRFEKVLYNEMQEPLCRAAEHNFGILGSHSISCNCARLEAGKVGEILGNFRPDITYMDPARRGEGGRKVFMLEECSPDVLSLKDELFRHCGNLLLKLSPMADISLICSKLGSNCREVHTVSSGGECKEVLIWMDREWKGDYSISAVELPVKYPEKDAAVFNFSPQEEKNAAYTLADKGGYLFEPGKSLTKAGAFKLVSSKFGIAKLGLSTHYYITDEKAQAKDLMKYGKVFEIINILPLDKRNLKIAADLCPKAEVTARNIPLTSDTLRKKLGVSPSDDHHIFGLKSDLSGAILMITKKMPAE